MKIKISSAEVDLRYLIKRIFKVLETFLSQGSKSGLGTCHWKINKKNSLRVFVLALVA